MNHLTLSDWMGGLPENIKKIPINQLSIPGSHDSGAYRVDFEHPISHSILFKIGNYAAEKFHFVGNIIKAWTVTQNENLYQQLESGIRYLDLRISYDLTNQNFYITHTFTCIPLSEAIGDISRFLQEHKQEILFITFKPGWYDRKDMTPQIGDRFIQKIQKKLGEILCQTTKESIFDQTMTLHNMVERGKRVVLYYGGNTTKKYDFLWDIKHLHQPWENTSNVIEKVHLLVQDLDGFKKTQYNVNGLFLTLTAQEEDVVSDVFKRIFLPCCYQPKSIHTLAEKIHQVIPTFIQENAEALKKVTLFVTDFPNRKYVELVISRNYG